MQNLNSLSTQFDGETCCLATAGAVLFGLSQEMKWGRVGFPHESETPTGYFTLSRYGTVYAGYLRQDDAESYRLCTYHFGTGEVRTIATGSECSPVYGVTATGNILIEEWNPPAERRLILLDQTGHRITESAWHQAGAFVFRSSDQVQLSPQGDLVFVATYRQIGPYPEQVGHYVDMLDAETLERQASRKLPGPLLGSASVSPRADHLLIWHPQADFAVASMGSRIVRPVTLKTGPDSMSAESNTYVLGWAGLRSILPDFGHFSDHPGVVVG